MESSCLRAIQSPSSSWDLWSPRLLAAADLSRLMKSRPCHVIRVVDLALSWDELLQKAFGGGTNSDASRPSQAVRADSDRHAGKRRRRPLLHPQAAAPAARGFQNRHGLGERAPPRKEAEAAASEPLRAEARTAAHGADSWKAPGCGARWLSRPSMLLDRRANLKLHSVCKGWSK